MKKKSPPKKRKSESKSEKGEALRLIDDAYKSIKEMMFRHNMVPGQKLLSKDLSEMLNMSRTPIINALYQLEKEGFIISIPYRGFYIKPLTIEETNMLFEVREALEVMCIELAIARLKPSDVRQLERVQKKHASYMPPYYDRRKVALGVDFHLQIAQISGNTMLEKLLTTNMEQEYLRYAVDKLDPRRMQRAVDEHYKLIELMKEKNVKKSITLIKKHIKRSKNHLANVLEREQNENHTLFARRRNI